MEASETPRARLPSLLFRVLNRSPKEGVNTCTSPVTVQATSKYCYQASEMLGPKSQPPPRSLSQAFPPPLPAEHGKACFPRLFKRRVHGFWSLNTTKGITPSATSTKTRSANSKRIIPCFHAPLSPLSRKPGSSSSSFCISSPVCNTLIKENNSQVLDIRSPKAKQLPRLPSRFSEYTSASEVATGVRAVPVEPSNASSELLNVSSDCLVVEANKLLPGFPKEVTLAVPPKRHFRKVPPSLPADAWELVEEARINSQFALGNKACNVFPTSLHRDDLEEKPVSLADVFLDQGQEGTRESAAIGMSPNTKVLMFGTNAVLPDHIVQAFIGTRVFPRCADRASRKTASAAMRLEQPATSDNEIIHGAVNEDEHMSDVQTATTDSLSPSASGYRSEDTPTYATTPALSSADSASIYSCSSAAYSTNDDVTVAVSSPNESDLDGKCFEVVVNEAKDQLASLRTVEPSPRQLVARSFPSGLSISIPDKAPPLRNAVASDGIHSENLSIPEVTAVSNGPTIQLPRADTAIEDQGERCCNPSGLEDVSLTSVETVSEQRRSRRHGTVYGTHEPKVPFSPHCANNPTSHQGPKPETSTCTSVAHDYGRPHASITYRADLRPGLRPLLLPRLLPQYHDQRSSKTTPGSGSLLPLTLREDLASVYPTVCSPQNPAYDISGTPESEWSFVSTSPTTEPGNDGLPLLRPEHIKLRRSKSSRLLLVSGPAF